MSEYYCQYLPGDEIKLNLEIRSPRMDLREAGVVFRHGERDTSELSASGRAVATPGCLKFDSRAISISST